MHIQEFAAELTPKAAAEALLRPMPRRLAAGAMVTRIGPSPTGMMHVGTLYVAAINLALARQSDGRCFLRIEDTDREREVAGAQAFIIDTLQRFGLDFAEGPHLQSDTPYGPYVQSERVPLYAAFVRQLLIQGTAYPCFCTAEELSRMRTEQENASVRMGYYGRWAKWRRASPSAIRHALNAGKPYVIRLSSSGMHGRKRAVYDAIFGTRHVSEPDQDVILLKSDGTPTYHLAHVVDDHLMGTTHVIRGEEWLASLPLHLQLFESFGWEPPVYAHVAPIQKMDGTKRRKLSKRKDPEAALSFFAKSGYPEEALLDYLMSLSSAKFEHWRQDNPAQPATAFPLRLTDCQAGGGPLFDFDKLGSISREYIAQLTAAEVSLRLTQWANDHDHELYAVIENRSTYLTSIVGIERGGEKPRKDLSTWSEFREDIGFFFDELFHPNHEKLGAQMGSLTGDEAKKMATEFASQYNPGADREHWFALLRSTASSNGFAVLAREFKENPAAFKGNLADAARVLRLFLTGKAITADLFSIMRVLGPDRVADRLKH